MSDVQDTTNKQPVKRPLSPREEAMEAIGQSRNAEFTKETGIVIESSAVVIDPDIDPELAATEAERARLAAAAEAGTPGETVTDEDAQQRALQQQQDDEAREREAAAAREAQEATQRAAITSLAPDAKITIKVNGRDMEMTGEEAMRRLQKDVSADVRLEEASRILRDAQSQQAAIQQQQREAEEAAQRGGNPQGVTVDPAVSKKFTDALFKGDAEQATQAFNEAVSSAVAAAQGTGTGRGNATPEVNPAAIAAQVRQQIAIDSALERSRTDYPDLYADPDIEAVAATKIDRLVKSGKPFVTALDEVQTEMATKFGWKRATSRTPTPAANTDRRSEKQARKESLEQQPGGPTVKSTTQEPVQASVSDTIREMAKARGQHIP